jgi:hypothetical protein
MENNCKQECETSVTLSVNGFALGSAAVPHWPTAIQGGT